MLLIRTGKWFFLISRHNLEKKLTARSKLLHSYGTYFTIEGFEVLNFSQWKGLFSQLFLFSVYFMCSVVIRNRTFNINKFSFWDFTANYLSKFQDRKIIFSLFDTENIFLLNDIKKSICFAKDYLKRNRILQTPKNSIVIRNIYYNF